MRFLVYNEHMPHELLRQLYLEDIADRERVTNWSDQQQLTQLKARDKTRRMQTQQFIKDQQLSEAEDYYHAALIFQHGDAVDDFQTAHHLARQAMNYGFEGAKWMYASTYDRWQLAAGKAQVYGTQFVLSSTGVWQFAEPLDRTFPDEERIKYNVPPLEKAIEEFQKRNAPKQ